MDEKGGHYLYAKEVVGSLTSPCLDKGTYPIKLKDILVKSMSGKENSKIHLMAASISFMAGSFNF